MGIESRCILSASSHVLFVVPVFLGGFGVCGMLAFVACLNGFKGM